jgi:hypothetical protein
MELSAKDKECCVCLQRHYFLDAVAYPCKHAFCSSCGERREVLSDRCPLCSHPVMCWGGIGPDLHIIVQRLSGKFVRVNNVKSSWTIEELKSKIAVLEDTPAGQQRLSFNGKQLFDERTLSDYNIQRGSCIQLWLSLRGD